MVNKAVYKPSDFAVKIGIVEEEIVYKRSGELKAQIKLGESGEAWVPAQVTQTSYFHDPSWS